MTVALSHPIDFGTTAVELARTLIGAMLLVDGRLIALAIRKSSTLRRRSVRSLG